MTYNSDMVDEKDICGTLVPYLSRLESKIDAQAAEIISLRSALPIKETMTITDIARKLGVAQSSLYSKCWNLPNFGKPDIGNNPRRWKRSTFESWYSVPEIERRKRWESMTDSQKQRALE